MQSKELTDAMLALQAANWVGGFIVWALAHGRAVTLEEIEAKFETKVELETLIEAELADSDVDLDGG